MNKFLAFILAGSWLTAHAEFFTGNDLLHKMRGNSIAQLEAMHYVAGATDTLRGVIACPPPDVTLGQINDLVRQYLERNPETRHRPGDWAVATALRGPWPCAKSGPGARL